MGNPGGLKPKHYAALELWEEGILSIKEIAGSVGLSVDTMYDMFEGNSAKAGPIAHLFKAELDKITVRSASKVRHLVKDNKKISLLMLNERLKKLRAKKTRNETDSREIVNIMNTLNKATPGIEIGSMHALTVHKGMTPEELVYEFQRLRAIANNSFNPKGVREAKEGRQDGLFGASESGSPDTEE